MKATAIINFVANFVWACVGGLVEWLRAGMTDKGLVRNKKGGMKMKATAWSSFAGLVLAFLIGLGNRVANGSRFLTSHFSLLTQKGLVLACTEGFADGRRFLTSRFSLLTYSSLLISLVLVCVVGFVAPVQATTYYVKQGGSDTASGVDWDNAFATITKALGTAHSATSDEIWVKAGTYKPDSSSRDNTFELVANVPVYGGFSGSENFRSERNWVSNPTILSGDNNSYSVVTGATGATLDGFTITKGNANGSSGHPPRFGGGFYNTASNVTLVNCIFSQNKAEYGGGLFNGIYGTASVTVINCLFIENKATNGGGIRNRNGTVTVTNCTFVGNTGDGKSISNNDNATAKNCIFAGTVSSELDSVSPTYSLADGLTGTDNKDVSDFDTVFFNYSGGDYRLKSDSPAIDAGNNIGTVSPDLSGNARIYNTTVDMGAYEYQPDINVKEGSTNIAKDSTYNFLDIELGDTPIETTFTVENVGQADLNIGSAVSMNSTDYFTLTDATSYPATLGTSITFKVKFNPPAPGSGGSGGSKEATITIPNDDPDEGTSYTFKVKGNALAIPEINVKQDSTNLVDDSGNYSFSKTKIGESSNAVEFTIENTRTGPLTITNVTGDDNFNFDVQNLISTTIDPYSSATFTIAFSPKSPDGNKTATITIANNDSDEDPYTFKVHGEASFTAPEINLKDLDDNDIAISGTYKFTDTPVDGTSGTKTFTIENDGDAYLTLTGTPNKVVISGTDASQFSIGSYPTSPISQSGGSTTFTVEFEPTGNGLKTATVSIANNDSNENPYTFTIKGTGVDTFPEMNITQGLDSIVDNTGSYDFGSVGLGNTLGPITFTIENTGTANLSLSDTPKIKKIGGNDTDFIISQSSTASSVADSGSSTTFSIAFTPSAGGSRTTTISIANNDSDENPYNFKVEGTGDTAPEINVKQGTTQIAKGGSYDFGNINLGSSSGARTFTIENVGNEDLYLNGSGVTISSGSGEFSLNNTSSSPIAGGNSTTFTVTFSPTGSPGSKSATISISNSDADESTYNFTLLGTGMTSQSIAFNPISSKTYGDPAFGVSASASSGRGVSFTSLSPSVASVSGNIVTLLCAGTATIQASQAGGAGYHPAPSINQSFTVTKADQTISFSALPVKTYGDPSFSLSATASSGLPVSFSSSNPSAATIDVNVVTIVGAGTSVITAYQAGNTCYNAAPSAGQSLVVNGLSQSISDFVFTPGLPSLINIGDSFSMSAKASSNLSVSFVSKNTVVATISGNKVTAAAGGTTQVCASQAGNSIYSPVEDCKTFTVNHPPEITEGSSVSVSTNENERITKTLNAVDNDGDTITWKIATPASHGRASGSGSGTSKNFSYTPDGDWFGSDSFVVETTDGRGGSDSITVRVSVAAVNDAPVLDTSEEHTLTPISEDPAANSGTSVSDIIIDGTITDVDGTAIEALAVVFVDNSNGVWQYTTDGHTWRDFSDVRGTTADIENEARLLDSSHKIRFVPDPNYPGMNPEGSARFTFRAWDRSDGAAGGTANTGNNGGISAFSTGIAQAVITVNQVDDAPVVAVPIEDIMIMEKIPGGYIEPSKREINLNSVFHDIDNSDSLIVKSVEILDFSNVGPDSELDLLTMEISDNILNIDYEYYQNGEASVTILADSNGLEVRESFSITVVSIDNPQQIQIVDPEDFPTLTDVVEDSVYNSGNSVAEIMGDDFIVDPDGDTVVAIAVTSVDNRIGTWQYSTDNGATWEDFTTENGSVTGMEHEARLLDSDDRVRFIPNPGYYGKSGFTFKSWDMSSGMSGGTADVRGNTSETFSSATGSARVRIGAVDDPPFVANALSDMQIAPYADDISINLRNVFGDPDNAPDDIGKFLTANSNSPLVKTMVSGNILSLDFGDNPAVGDSAEIVILGISNGKNVTDTFTITVADTPCELCDPACDNTCEPGPPVLSDIDEDESDNPGNSISEIFPLGVISSVEFPTDADGETIRAIAVTGVENLIGKWQYSVSLNEKGAPLWENFTSTTGRYVSLEENPRLLDAHHRIRFLPKENYYGGATFVFQAWDKTQGESGGTLNLTSRDVGDSLSDASDDASVRINPVDDPPFVAKPIEDIVRIDEFPESLDIWLLDVFSDSDASESPTKMPKELEYNSDSEFVNATLNGNLLTLEFLQSGEYGHTDISIRATSDEKSVSDAFSVTIRGPNHAPSLDRLYSPELKSLVQNPVDNPGTRVAAILPDGAVSDSDAEGAVKAVAVTEVDNSDGVWQYSHDGGDSWNVFSPAIGGVDNIEENARLLDENYLIKFVPNTDFIGTASFKFRAWDKSAGVAGHVADVSIAGGETAFSFETDTATVRVYETGEVVCADGITDPGDVNADGSVDLKDMIIALRLAAGFEEEVTDEEICRYADVNEDGYIGIEEAVYVLRKLAE